MCLNSVDQASAAALDATQDKVAPDIGLAVVNPIDPAYVEPVNPLQSSRRQLPSPIVVRQHAAVSGGTMAVLIKDVARYAKTSPATVSQVFNGRQTTIRVSEATRKRVLHAAEVLGYRANPHAQSLRTRRTTTIGIVFQGMSDNAARLEALHHQAGSAGYQLLLAISGAEAAGQEQEIQRLLHLKIDGLAILSPSLEEVKQPTLNQLVKQKFPVICIGPQLLTGCDTVDWDRQTAYADLTTHLVQRGCQRFLFLGHADTPGVRLRLDGIKQTLGRSKRSQLRLARADTDLEKTIAKQVAEGWPDAVICSTDQLAAQVIQAAAAVGRRIPQEMAVTGCSDVPFSSLLTVPLTTLRMPQTVLATFAMSRLIERIEHPETGRKPFHKLVPAEVVLRQSSQFGDRNS